jgi:hypothetical protein
MTQPPPDPATPPDFLVRLVQLRSSGLPYRDIAAVLSFEYSRAITRNAISGLVHRMKLPPLPRPPRAGRIRIRTRPPRKPPKQPPPVILVEPPPPPPPPLPTGTYGFFDLLPSSCRYPTGDGPFLFCGETKANGPYCKTHAKRCFHG